MTQTPMKQEDRIQAICKSLKEETLEPALQQAKQMIEEAEKKAEELLKKAKEDADAILVEAKQSAKQHKSVVEASLEQSSKQVVAAIKEEIEKGLFNTEIHKLVEDGTSGADVVAKLIKALIQAVEKEGTNAEVSAIIPKALSVDEVNKALGKKIVEHLRKKSVVLGGFSGGAQVRLHNQKLTLDISDPVIAKSLEEFIREDFRKFVFKNPSEGNV